MIVALRRRGYGSAMAFQIQSPYRQNTSEASGESLRSPRRWNDALWPRVLNKPGAKAPTQR
jgi:hypothetical protein